MTTVCRCPWVDASKPDYLAYHDREWGVPVHEEHTWFEFLTLEGAQAGLSWYTVLRKRDRYRQVFAAFDPAAVAAFDGDRIETLLQDPGIIRNRAKITATVANARRFLAVQAEFGSFDGYIWRFVDGRPRLNSFQHSHDYPATTATSDALSRDLRQRGFGFVGSTICYALMQATGLVNDHTLDCFRRAEIMASYHR